MKNLESPPKLSPEAWRWGIIGQLILQTSSGQTRQEILEECALQQHIRPDGTPCQISAETLRKWISRYNAFGIDGLKDKSRKRGIGISIPEPMTTALAQLRLEQPRWSMTLLLEQMKKTALWDGFHPSRATMFRYLCAHQLHRDPTKVTPNPRSFEHAAFGSLWIADFLHGPRVYAGSTKRKVYLHAIIDDHSRFVPVAHFHLEESSEALVTDLREAIRRHGIAIAFYTDNGAAFKTIHLRQIAARLRMACPHSPPYVPEGRGKIERFFRTVRECFLAKDTSKTFTQLETNFQIWLAEYHQNYHQGIKCSPLEAKLKSSSLCRLLPEATPIDSLFTIQRHCRVHKDGTVRIKGVSYEVHQAVPLTRTLVNFLPWDLNMIWYGPDNLPAKPLDKLANARRLEHRPKNTSKETMK